MTSSSWLPGNIAVIDVETTGLFPSRHDRVLELAVVVIGPNGTIEREFASLTNPSRDVGRTSIHGLAAEDILHAPRFADIAALLIDVLDESVAIAGHNVRFDRQFMESEFSRLGHPFPECFCLCTMELGWGGSLSDSCRDYGILLEGEAHNALTDARATAKLLLRLLLDQPGIVRTLGSLTPIQWPTVPRSAKRPLTRDESRRSRTESPTFLQRMLVRLPQPSLPILIDGAAMAYVSLVDRVIEDRRVDDSEAEALYETAVKWGIDENQMHLIHRDYLERLAVAALADGVVSEAELRDLKTVARLLGQTSRGPEEILHEASANMAGMKTGRIEAENVGDSLVGRRVCFTGEMMCTYEGKVISRELAEELASKAGFEVVDSVSKKVDMLVVADPFTQSGKAKKARQYGIRIMHEPVFWKAIGISVQ